MHACMKAEIISQKWRGTWNTYVYVYTAIDTRTSMTPVYSLPERKLQQNQSKPHSLHKRMSVAIQQPISAGIHLHRTNIDDLLLHEMNYEQHLFPRFYAYIIIIIRCILLWARGE